MIKIVQIWLYLFILLLCNIQLITTDGEKTSLKDFFRIKAFHHLPSLSTIGLPLTTSIFDRVPFKPSAGKKNIPLISLNVRAYSRIVYTKKDSLLEEVSNATDFKKEQEKQFKEAEIASEKDEKDKEEAHFEDDEFRMIYDEEKKEYVLLNPSTTTISTTTETREWTGGDSKEEREDGDGDEDEKIKEILEGGDEKETEEKEEMKKEFIHIDETEEQHEFDIDNYTDTHYHKKGKSKIKHKNLAYMDERFFEKEEFSVKMTVQEKANWRDRLMNLTMLEERSADEHRDYGSSYILPVLKSVNYDNTSVPLAFNDIPVNVAVAFNFLYLANFDSEMMEYSMDVEMEFAWFDIRLVNNYTKPIRIREKPIIEQIWKPDPYIVNSKYSYFHYVSFPNIRMRITPQGLVTYTLRVSSVCSCFMSFCLYPHDRQECDLKISSIAYSNQYLKFYWHSTPIRFQSKITLPELHITKIKTGDCRTDGKMIDSSCLRILFNLERDSARFVIEKYVPSTLAMMFAWVAPYVPYNYEDVRIITPITVLLTLVQMEKGDKEIKTSYLTSIDVWFAAMKSFTVLSLLESLVVLALIKQSRAMTKNAERAANEFERCTFEAEAYRLNRLYHRVDSICRFSSPLVFIIFFMYYVLFIAQGNENCVDSQL